MFSGCLTRVRVDRAALASLLPPGTLLRNGTPRICDVLLVFGEQAEGVTYFGGVPFRWGIRYHELLVAIPFVRVRGSSDEHLFVTGMTCDFAPAVWNGNQFYGFRKRYVPMSWTRDKFVVGVAEAEFTGAVHAERSVEKEVEEWWRWASTMPVLGEREDNSLVHSRFDWSFKESKLEAADVRVHVETSFRELPAGTYAQAGVRVSNMRWRLSWPSPA